MNINLIDLLKQKVSAVVLEGETEHLSEKSQALSSFYPILLSIFKSKPGLISNVQNQLNPRLSDIFSANPALKNQFLEQISGTVPTAVIESTLNRSIAPTLGVLEEEAGSSEPNAIVHLIETHWNDVSNALPHWALALLSALGISTASGHSLHQAPETEPYPVVEEKKKTGFLLPLIALIILAALLALIFRACSDKKETEPTTMATQTAASEPAKLQLSTGATGDLTTCQLYSGNASYVDILQQNIKQIFNHNLGCGAETTANYHTEFIDQDAIPSVLKLVKGVPNASLTWIGNQLSVQAANPTDAQQLAAKIQPLVRNMTVTTAAADMAASMPMDNNTAITSGNNNAEKALAEINPENIHALDVATALNLQIINFDTASAQIPDANKAILDQAAGLMKRAPQVKLTVKGHTDAVGNANSNKTLSQKRAQAVVDYLVQQGVDPAQLQPVGYGQEQPVADNATPEGQFKNRRIEFEVLNTETGVVREVNDEGIKQQ